MNGIKSHESCTFSETITHVVQCSGGLTDDVSAADKTLGLI